MVAISLWGVVNDLEVLCLFEVNAVKVEKGFKHLVLFNRHKHICKLKN